MGGDGTRRFQRCWSVLMDAPVSSVANHDHWRRMWLPPTSCCIAAHRLLAPRFATRRDNSLPSPWHVEVVVAARRAVHMLGRVGPCAHAPWGYCKTNHWVARHPYAVFVTLYAPAPGSNLARFPPKPPRISKGESWVAMERERFIGARVPC